MRGLTSALEKMDMYGPTGSLNETLLEVGECSRMFDEADRELSALESVLDNAEKAINHLRSLRSTINEHGISRPMMLAADPKEELVKLRIVGSYESLGAVQEPADDVVAKLDQTITESLEKVTGYLKIFKSYLKKYFDAISRGFKGYMKAITSSVQKMNAAGLDDKTIASTKVKAIAKDDFMKVIDSTLGLVNMFKKGALGSALEQIVKTIEDEVAIDREGRIVGPKKGSQADIGKIIKTAKGVREAFFKDVKKFDQELTGIAIDESFDFDETRSDDVDIRISGFPFDKVKSELGKLGWKRNDITKAADGTKAILKAVDELDSAVKKTAGNLEKIEASVSGYKWAVILAFVGALLLTPAMVPILGIVLGFIIGVNIDRGQVAAKLRVDKQDIDALARELANVRWILQSTYYGIRASYINAQNLSNMIISISKAAAK